MAICGKIYCYVHTPTVHPAAISHFFVFLCQILVCQIFDLPVAIWPTSGQPTNIVTLDCFYQSGSAIISRLATILGSWGGFQESARLPRVPSKSHFWGATLLVPLWGKNCTKRQGNREIATGWAVEVLVPRAWKQIPPPIAILKPTPNNHRLHLLSHVLCSA